MKQLKWLLLFGVLWVPLSKTQAAFQPMRYVQISTGSLQPGTTAGIWISSGTINDFKATQSTITFLTATNLTITNPSGLASLTSTNTFTQGQLFNAWIAVAGTSTLTGVTDGSSAAAGKVGEYVSSVTANNHTFPASGQYGDLVSIAFTAGDWLLALSFQANANGGTITDVGAGISSTAGNNSTGLTTGDNFANSVVPPVVTYDVFIAIAQVHVAINATTTYYLKIFHEGSVAIPRAKGRLSGVRIR